jgi:phage replication O-like protein O
MVVLAAVVSLTAGWSKLSDWVTAAQLEELTRLHPKNLARALRSLAASGIIVYRAERGRGARVLVGLQPRRRAEQVVAPGMG